MASTSHGSTAEFEAKGIIDLFAGFERALASIADDTEIAKPPRLKSRARLDCFLDDRFASNYDGL